MNQYTKHIWKRNITAFLLSCGILISLALVVLLLAFLASIFREQLPYITTGILLFLFALGLSIPIRYHLKDREDTKFWLDKKEKERLLMEADVEIDRLRKEADRKEYEEMVRIRLEKKDEANRRKLESEAMRAAHAVRKRDNLI